MKEEIKVRTVEQLERENYLLLYKSKAQIVNILIDAEEEIKRLKQQNEFLMKQDNILQSLMQWLYKQIPDDKTIITKYIKVFDVIDKIKELKEEMK